MDRLNFIFRFLTLKINILKQSDLKTSLWPKQTWHLKHTWTGKSYYKHSKNDKWIQFSF